MKQLYLFALILCLISSKAQNWAWGKAGNIIEASFDPSFSPPARITGGNGLVYVTAFNKSPAWYGSTMIQQGFCLLQYDSQGNLIWAKSLSYKPQYACADASGNLYIAGSCAAILQTDSVVLYGYMDDFFVLKLDPTGAEIWARRFGDSPIESISDMVCDKAGNVYLTGGFMKDAFCDSLKFDAFSLKNTSKLGHMFVTRLNTNGQVDWAKTGLINYSQSQIDYVGINLSLDPQENIYVMGYGEGCQTSCADFIIAGYNSVGQMIYHKSLWGKWVYHEIFDFAACSNSEFIILAENHPKYPNGSYMTKYDSLLGNKWSYQINWHPSWPGLKEYVESGLTIDSLNNIYLTGPFTSTYGVPAPSTYTWFGNVLPYSGNNDAALVKFNSAGVTQWVRTIASAGSEQTTDLYVSSSGECYVTGYYENFTDTSEIIINQDTLINHYQQQTLFTAKLNTTGGTPVAIVENHDSSFSVYPVPADEFLTVTGIKENCTVILRDISSNIVIKVWLQPNDKIDCTDLSAGVYFLEVQNKKQSQFKKIIVE